MNIIQRSTLLSSLVAAVVLTVTMTFAPALASTSSPSGGVVTNSLNQCPSGDLCIWSGSNYTGSIARYSSTGTYSSITLPTNGSLWNNRTKRSYVYEDAGGGGVSACYSAGAQRATLSGWLVSANSVYLSTSTYC